MSDAFKAKVANSKVGIATSQMPSESSAKALRQPNQAISAAMMIGTTIEPALAPSMATPIAVPCERWKRCETMTLTEMIVPGPAMPSIMPRT